MARNLDKEYPKPFYLSNVADALSILCFAFANIMTLYFISDGFSQTEALSVFQHMLNRFL